MTDLVRFAELLWGTVIYRPYVYVFFICFLFFALKQLRVAGCLAYIALAYLIAFACEYSATRNGFPFGVYRYFDETRTRELWISNIPFWDSLSFVFLSYFSWRLAAAIRGNNFKEPRTFFLAGILMMALDVVIDPLTLLGDRWFLGRIYDYPDGGTYFGVTLSNFFGWFFVGCVIPMAFSALAAFVRPFRGWQETTTLEAWAVFGVYAGVFIFNLAITFYIGEWTLLSASSIVAGCTLGSAAFSLTRLQPRPKAFTKAQKDPLESAMT